MQDISITSSQSSQAKSNITGAGGALQHQQPAKQQEPKSPSRVVKSKLKAAGLWLAEGLSWSSTARAAFPVPMYPPIIA